jgi:hypothetical protein
MPIIILCPRKGEQSFRQTFKLLDSAFTLSHKMVLGRARLLAAAEQVDFGWRSALATCGKMQFVNHFERAQFQSSGAAKLREISPALSRCDKGPIFYRALSQARAVLTAAGFGSFVFRDAHEPDWQRGFKETVALVCDVLTAAELRSGVRAIPFSLLSETAIAELRHFKEFAQPLENSDA